MPNEQANGSWRGTGIQQPHMKWRISKNRGHCLHFVRHGCIAKSIYRTWQINQQSRHRRVDKSSPQRISPVSCLLTRAMKSTSLNILAAQLLALIFPLFVVRYASFTIWFESQERGQLFHATYYTLMWPGFIILTCGLGYVFSFYQWQTEFILMRKLISLLPLKIAGTSVFFNIKVSHKLWYLY